MITAETILRRVRAYQHNPSSPTAYARLFNALRKRSPHLDEEATQGIIDRLSVSGNVKEPNIIDSEVLLNSDATEGLEQVRVLLRGKLGAECKRSEVLRDLINRKGHMLPLALRYLKGDAPEVHDEVKDFAKHIAVAVNRLYSTERVFVKALSPTSVARGHVVSMMLMLSFGTKTNDKLLTSLDFNSLVRLSILCGGETVTIPTWAELEETLAVVYYQYLIQYRKMEKPQALKTVRQDLHIEISAKQANKDVRILLKLMDTELNRASSPVTTQLEDVINRLESLQQVLEKSIKEVEDPDTIIDLYREINESIVALAAGLVGNTGFIKQGG